MLMYISALVLPYLSLSFNQILVLRSYCLRSSFILSTFFVHIIYVLRSYYPRSSFISTFFVHIHVVLAVAIDTIIVVVNVIDVAYYRPYCRRPRLRRQCLSYLSSNVLLTPYFDALCRGVAAASGFQPSLSRRTRKMASVASPEINPKS